MAFLDSFNLNHQALAYSATTLGAGMMNSVFMTYYVKTYLNRFHVSEEWFHVSQIIFMIWNAINDPLFGYIQDNFTFSWVKSRRHSILYGAPLFAISFLVTWVPWGDYSEPTWLCGFQLTFSLCFYDTMYTFVLLAQCALFTEISELQEDRIRLIKYSQAASCLGSTAVFFTGLASKNGQDYGIFIVCCIGVSVLSFSFMAYTGKNSYTKYDLKHKKVPESKQTHSELRTKEEPQYSIFRQMFQIITQRNFVSFVFMNLGQIYQRTFIYNFVMIVCDRLISRNDMTSGARSIFYGSLHTVPQMAVILATSTPFLSTHGYYNIIKRSFILKILMGFGLFIIGPKWWAIVLFFLVESTESSAVFHTFNLTISDIIDQDKETYQRKMPLSSMVYGTNALITKPAQSLAPILSVAILNRFGYHQLKGSDDSDVVVSEEYEVLQNALFVVTCLTPIIVGVFQLFVWSFYRVKSQKIISQTVGSNINQKTENK